jgi:hypothetical protein
MLVGALECVGPLGKIARLRHELEHAVSRCLDADSLHVEGLHRLVLLLRPHAGIDSQGGGGGANSDSSDRSGRQRLAPVNFRNALTSLVSYSLAANRKARMRIGAASARPLATSASRAGGRFAALDPRWILRRKRHERCAPSAPGVWDLRVQARERIYLFTFMTTGLFAVAVALLPDKARATVVTGILFLDPAVVGAGFVAGLVLLERSQNTPPALAVTPASPADYVLAKLITFAVLTIAGGLASVCVADWPPSAGLLLRMALALTFCGVLGVLVGLVMGRRPIPSTTSSPAPFRSRSYCTCRSSPTSGPSRDGWLGCCSGATRATPCCAPCFGPPIPQRSHLWRRSTPLALWRC